MLLITYKGFIKINSVKYHGDQFKFTSMAADRLRTSFILEVAFLSLAGIIGYRILKMGTTIALVT